MSLSFALFIIDHDMNVDYVRNEHVLVLKCVQFLRVCKTLVVRIFLNEGLGILPPLFQHSIHKIARIAVIKDKYFKDFILERINRCNRCKYINSRGKSYSFFILLGWLMTVSRIFQNVFFDHLSFVVDATIMESNKCPVRIAQRVFFVMRLKPSILDLWGL